MTAQDLMEILAVEPGDAPVVIRYKGHFVVVDEARARPLVVDADGRAREPLSPTSHTTLCILID